MRTFNEQTQLHNDEVAIFTISQRNITYRIRHNLKHDYYAIEAHHGDIFWNQRGNVTNDEANAFAQLNDILYKNA